MIDEGKKGIFGIFGSRPAVVKVSVTTIRLKKSREFFQNVSEKMGVQCQKLKLKRDGKAMLNFILSGEKIALLIGKRGQTLNSLQYLTQLVINRFSEQYLNVIVDAEDYRNDEMIR